MIVDSSAAVAVAFDEPGAGSLVDKLSRSTWSGMGTPTIAETGVVLAARLGRDPLDLVPRLLHELRIEEVPFGAEHWRETLRAYWRYGRARHPAQLNFGDCLAYAVARLADQPLLFVGRDFARTDIEAA